MTKNLKAFISYSHLDEHAVGRLTKHLSMLRRDGAITEWFDQKISAGGDIDAEISKRLDECDLFIALVSPDFLASRYCYEREMVRALERNEAGTMRIVPIVVEPCDWKSSPLGKLKALPKDGKPVSDWTNPNTAWLDVVTQLRNLVEEIASQEALPPRSAPTKRVAASRYRVKKNFDAVDKMEFRERAFAVIRDYFAHASAEIGEVEHIKAKYSSMGDDAFTCTVVNRARDRAVAHITVYARSSRSSMGDISYSFNERAEPNTANGWMQIEADDYELHLAYHNFSHSGEDKKLTPEQAAERLWEELLERAGITYG